MLLITNPTPARLMSLHKIMLKETNPHMINYYRTTVMSISGTTYPCYEHLYVYNNFIAYILIL